MFKGSINYRFCFITFSKYLFVSFFVWLFFSISVFAFEVKLGDALDKFYDNYKRNSELSDLNWKAVVDDIYSKSLDTVQNNDMVPMFDAVDKTMWWLNKRHDCQLDKQDIINILYFSNAEFKRDLKNNLMWFKKPQKDAMGKSCNKLNVCVYNPKLWQIRNTVTLNNACQNETEKEFIQYYLNSYYMQTIEWWNKWSNFFWNASLEDSSYDIMTDVSNLAKILFQDVSEPAESRFYKMPKVDYQVIPVDDAINGNIDWFSPYNNQVMNSESSGSGDESGWSSGSDNASYSRGPWKGGSGGMSDDIISFIEWTNFDVWWNADSVVWWNACIAGTEFMWAAWYSSWVDGYELLTPWEYLSGLWSDLFTMSCNGDGVYQDWESPGCSDASSSSSTGVSDIDQIEALLNAAQQSGYDISDDPSALWCFQKCESVPCNATSCDKIICYAKCSCILYESPTFNPQINPWLTSVFKIKFCVVPVMENNLSTSKTVYNIAAIFSEIYKVLQDLRNSGEMAINVKTKEFLDNWLKDNDFGEQLSFSINNSAKPSFAQVSELTQTQEQLDLNTSRMEWILWFAKDPWLEQEKNKYLVMDDPCVYVVKKQSTKTVAQNNVLLESCQDERAKTIKMPEMDTMEKALKDQKTVLIDAEFESFLRQNRDFWIAVDDMFKVWLKSSESLSKK